MKLLWVGDAGVSTGFARATHYILNELRKEHEIVVLGINYMGEPHGYPYPIHPALTGGDAFGVYRIAQLAKAYKVDCIVLQNDVWNIPQYLDQLKEAKITCPVVGFLAVDGKNCQGYKLNDLDMAIFWTYFAEEEARLGGMTCPSRVVPLGVDLSIYQPMSRKEARAALSVSKVAKAQPKENSFIVLNVNRNHSRKRLDLTVEYFCDWIEQYKIDDAFLMFHACPTGEDDYDIAQLMEYRGHRNKLMLFTPHIGYGVSEAQLVVEYCMADVVVTTTQGEGFGLTTFEAMACGIPCIVPDWSALGELCKDAAYRITCTSYAATPKGINVIGGIADKFLFIDALQHLYTDHIARSFFSNKGIQRVNESQYRWENVGQSFSTILNEIL